MSNVNEFVRPEDMDYEVIAPTYQEAFKEDPWNEFSKCADKMAEKRCEGGFSPLQIGSNCGVCQEAPGREAYEAVELVSRFTALAESRPTLWYIEKAEDRVALAALCWLTTAERLCEDKYADVPAMSSWLQARFGSREFVYLDEIFRDKRVRAVGNLANFGEMVSGFSEAFANDIFVFRTKNERLINKTKEIFGNESVLRSTISVPDRRDLAVVTLGSALK